MKRGFRLQVEAAKKQSEEIMKVQVEVQSMQHRFEDVHLKLDETILLVKALVLESGHY